MLSLIKDFSKRKKINGRVRGQYFKRDLNHFAGKEKVVYLEMIPGSQSERTGKVSQRRMNMQCKRAFSIPLLWATGQISARTA